MRDRDTDFFGALFKVVFILVVSGFAVVLGLTVLEVVEVAKRRNDASSCVRWEATGALLCWGSSVSQHCEPERICTAWRVE